MDEHRAHDEQGEPAQVTPTPPPWAAWVPPADQDRQAASPPPPTMPPVPPVPPVAQVPPVPPVPPYRPGSPQGAVPPPPLVPPSPYDAASPYGSWPWGPAPENRRRSGRAFVALTVALGVLIAAAAGGVVGHEIWRAESNPSGSSAGGSGGLGGFPTSPTQNPDTGGGPQDAASIAEHVDPGLVDVNTEIDTQGLEGAGTGMVLTSTGVVLTNNHVVEGANRITVTDVGNGRTYSARVVGYDRSHDIAVLQLVGASGLQTVTTGDSSKINVGEGVVAIGNANGSGGTPTYAGGTITALGQTITASDQADGTSEELHDLIATDANVVSGDSGGPLVDGAGRVIGIDTAASGGYRFETSGTQGFAIPIDEALSVARQVEAGTSSSTVHIGPTALLGVEVRDTGTGFGRVGGGGSGAGADVVGVLGSGPAAQAGIVAGDVITSVDGHTVTSAESLTTVMLGEHPGTTVAVGYLDTSGQQQTVHLQLTTGPAQ